MEARGRKDIYLLDRLYKSPYRVIIAFITIWAFLFNILGYDLAWAYQPNGSVLPTSGTGAQGSSGHFSLDLDDFTIPSPLGEIKEIFRGSNGKTVIHIQDAHCNYSAQKSIRDIIGYLNTSYGVDLIGLEGGEGDYDLSVFTKIKDLELREKVANYFVKEGRVNGAELFAILNPDKITLKGLEEAKLYIRNLNVYRESLEHKDEVNGILGVLSSHIAKLKETTYSQELKDLDSKITAYHSGNLDFKEYLNYLYNLSPSLRAAEGGEAISTKSFKNLSQLIEVIDEEVNIDFNICNRERDELINDLKRSISKLELELLLKWTLEFKQGLIKEDEFYLFLLDKAEFCDIDIHRYYPNLIKYSRFLKKYESLDKYAVFEELKELEEHIFYNLSENDTQIQLYNLSKDFDILNKFFSASLTRDEFDYFKRNKERFIFSLQSIDAEATEGRRPEEVPSKARPISTTLNDYSQNFEQFYSLSLKRDKAFLKNLSRYMKKTNEVVLYTGGFHTESLKELLKKEGYSYIVILPKFDPQEQTPYFRLLSGKFNSNKKTKENISSLMIASQATPLGIKANGPDCRISREDLYNVADNILNPRTSPISEKDTRPIDKTASKGDLAPTKTSHFTTLLVFGVAIMLGTVALAFNLYYIPLINPWIDVSQLRFIIGMTPIGLVNGFIGGFIGQMLKHHIFISGDHSAKRYDLFKNLRQAIYEIFYGVPVYGFLIYGWLMRYIPGVEPLSPEFMQAFTNQIVLSPLLFNPMNYMVGKIFIERENYMKAIKEAQDNLLDYFILAFIVWTPAVYIAMGYENPIMTCCVMSFTSIIWAVVFSIVLQLEKIGFINGVKGFIAKCLPQPARKQSNKNTQKTNLLTLPNPTSPV